MQQCEQLPRDIVLHMANDVDTVSLPVLENTKVLSDAEVATLVKWIDDTFNALLPLWASTYRQA